MNRYKILFLTSTIIAIFLAIIFTVTIIKNKNNNDDPVKGAMIELIDGLIEETKDDLSKNFKYYEMRHYFINNSIDSLYILMKQEKPFHSSKLKNYYEEMLPNESQEAKIIFNMLNSIKNEQSQDFKMLSKFIEYRYIKRKIERSGYLSFFWLDGLGVNVCSKKDTVKMGEEYVASISYSGDIHNKSQQPIVVLDGDTLNADYGYCKFKEKPQRNGLVKHKGYMTYFHSSGIIEIPLEFEYYVK